LTQAQANALKQRLQQGAAAGAPLLGPPGAFVPRPFGLGRVGVGAPDAAVAKYLGLTNAQLVKQLESGQSLAAIAKAQGKTAAGLEQAITAAAKTHLDKAVANKRITAAQEQLLLKALSARINHLVNNTPPKLGRFGGARFGYHEAFRGGWAPRPGSYAPAPP